MLTAQKDQFFIVGITETDLYTSLFDLEAQATVRIENVLRYKAEFIAIKLGFDTLMSMNPEDSITMHSLILCLAFINCSSYVLEYQKS